MQDKQDSQKNKSLILQEILEKEKELASDKFRSYRKYESNSFKHGPILSSHWQ